MKKIRSLNLNKKIISAGVLLTIGILGTYLLNYFLRETYNSRKSEIEERIENLLDKKVDLGEYSGLRFLGISLENSKIIDRKNIDSEIKAKNLYVGIMPLSSFLKQKWIVKISPEQTEININRDFFRREKPYIKALSPKNSKLNYELNLNLKKYSILKIENSELNSKVKGTFTYKPNNRQIIANIKTKFDGKGFLKFKLNTMVNKDFLRLELFSRGLDLTNSEYSFGNRRIFFNKGNIKSNFKIYKSSNQIFCRGSFALTQVSIKPDNFSENINSDLIRFYCKDGNFIGNSKNINYGTLTSNFNLKTPFNIKSNEVKFKGNIGYLDSLNPEIKFSGNLPYWFDKRGINFGNIDSSFNINRTELSNLNIFRKNNVRGFITAEGELKGLISDPDILINFNVDYPHYKGIRIRETWEGDFKKEKNTFMLNMKNRYSPIPSFLSVKFDSGLKLDNLTFSRIFNSNNGTIKIVKDNEGYNWAADNFPIDELELSISKNQFDRISGIINGAGKISSDQYYLDGRLAWSLGKYRNIKLANSLFDFSFKDDKFYVNSTLYPIDGGMIDLEYNSNKKNQINVVLNNISGNWTILTAVDIFNFDNKKVKTISESNILDDLEINKDNNSFSERINFIKNFNENNKELEDKFNLKKYLNKFKSRYNGKITIQGDAAENYRLNAKLDGYLDVFIDDYKNNKEDFSIEMEGGLLRGEGLLRIKKLPLSVANIFLNQPRDFLGGLDINLLYDLDKKSFSSEIFSNNSTIKNNQIIFDKAIIAFNNSIFDIDFSLLINNSEIPIDIKGSIPINDLDKLDLSLIGNEKFIELMDIFSDDYFTFKEGEVNISMNLKGAINKPSIDGLIDIKDSEIEFYNNTVKDINGLMIFDFDNIQINNLQAKTDDSGNISISGSLPFYSKNNSSKGKINLITNKLKLKKNNFNFLLDSDMDLTGSFKNPVLGGNLSLNNGFINFNGNNKNKKMDSNIKQIEDDKDWPELNWNKTKNIEIISNETILNSVLLGETLPNYLNNLSFNNLKLKLGPNFKLQYSEIIQAYLETKLDLRINGEVGKDLNARGLIYLKKGTANLYTTPFKLDKNKDNYILFASRSGVVPYINFSLVSKVPDSIIPINENSQDPNISVDLNKDENSSGFGAFGIGNTRLIKIEASYEGFLDQLSFADENKRIRLRSTPSYSRSQIIGLIGGNSANLINRTFISQLNNADAFSERFQLSLYPTLIENNDSLNNIFSNEDLDIENNEESSLYEEFSSQAWVAEIGLDITDEINFAFQAVPGRDDLSTLGILTFQANPNLELLGSYDSNGDWKSEIQLFFRY